MKVLEHVAKLNRADSRFHLHLYEKALREKTVLVRPLRSKMWYMKGTAVFSSYLTGLVPNTGLMRPILCLWRAGSFLSSEGPGEEEMKFHAYHLDVSSICVTWNCTYDFFMTFWSLVIFCHIEVLCTSCLKNDLPHVFLGFLCWCLVVYSDVNMILCDIDHNWNSFSIPSMSLPYFVKQENNSIYNKIGLEQEFPWKCVRSLHQVRWGIENDTRMPIKYWLFVSFPVFIPAIYIYCLPESVRFLQLY